MTDTPASFLSLLPAIAVLLGAALLPHATARLLAIVLLRGVPEQEGEARARRLVPFRTAAMLVGFAQIQLAWMAGARALWGSPFSAALGAVAAAVAFLSGGVARRVEEPASDRSTAAGALVLRLRMLPWFVGTSAAAALAAALPVTSGPTISWGWTLTSLALCVVGVAYGGLLASVLLRALLPAGAALESIAREVAAREKTSLRLVLRLPTDGARFANAAAIPWARAMVVTDRIVEILSPEELRAVLAHEAGHLSEPPRVLAARLGSASLLLFALTAGTRIAEALGVPMSIAAVLGLLVAVVLLMGARRLARGMEERADARARDTVGAAALAEALRKLHAYMQAPMVTGARRVHPDLYDRLVALGINPGPRPEPPPRRRGLVVGVAMSAVLLAAGAHLVGVFAG